MDVFVVIAALSIGVAALIHLARTDPKRRRVFGLPAHVGPRRTRIALAALIVPGIGLLALGNGAGFTVWLGALTVLGWGVAALDPVRSQALLSRAAGMTGKLGGTARAAWHGSAEAVRTLRDGYRFLSKGPARIAALEERVAELEAQLAGTEAQEQDTAERRIA